MRINENTKIGVLIKQNPEALEAIISVNPKFEKLRNPLLRKLMASRTTILQASKISGCQPGDFFKKLRPLGFEIEQASTDPVPSNPELPQYLKNIDPAMIVSFDVRPILNSNADPLKDIQQKIKSLLPGQVLKIINTFEPTPLMSLLKRQGFESFADKISDDLIETYFYKEKSDLHDTTAEQKPENNNDWDEILQKYSGRIIKADVRHLEMPQPMLTILAELDKLSPGSALYVHHKRIPVFLLPELKERGFDYRINELSDNEVYLLIFKS
jgi:uncharacterized protein (DUF2249 family)